MATKVDMEFANFEAKLSLNNPVADYIKLIDDKMKADVIMPHEVYNECWKRISDATRQTIWKMLFDEKEPPQKEQLKKASELLKVHKEDACFYQAAEYNKWIVLVRDELLKRGMLDFWKTEIVQKELGPCWARDSDLFDDTEDPEPANFYKYAGCEAPWLKKEQQNVASNPADLVSAALFNTKCDTKKDKILKNISMKTPLDDYKYNMENEGNSSCDNEEAFKEIFAQARDIVWQLLFSEPSLTGENSKKAAELLEEYKRDACFYCPWDYNDWILKVKEELLKRHYLDFWQNVVVKKELGLCWARDSDYFDDMDDPAPLEFYKIDEDVNKQKS